MPQINLTHFGDCNSKMFFEQAKKEADEKYKAEANDNFFEKAGKVIAKSATKAAAAVQGCLGMNKCQLDIPLPWIFCNDEHMIDGAPALTIDSVCTCKFGGVIKIVEETEESNVEIEEQTEEETVHVSMTPAYAGEEIQVNLLQNTQQKTAAEDGGDSDKLLKKNKKIFRKRIDKTERLREQIEKSKEMRYINKYVNEETLIQINPARWGEIGKDENGNEVYVAIEALKKNYEDDVFEQIGRGMYKYGITDETSILMLLSTIGTETYYGTSVVQGKKGNPAQGLKADELPSISSSLGVGLLQVTSLANQQEFIRYKYDSLEDGTDEKNLIKNILII